MRACSHYKIKHILPTKKSLQVECLEDALFSQQLYFNSVFAFFIHCHIRVFFFLKNFPKIPFFIYIYSTCLNDLFMLCEPLWQNLIILSVFILKFASGFREGENENDHFTCGACHMLLQKWLSVLCVITERNKVTKYCQVITKKGSKLQ